MKRSIVILGIIILFFVAIFAYFFEFREVSDYSIKNQYELYNKDDLGLWMFNKFLTEAYDLKKVKEIYHLDSIIRDSTSLFIKMDHPTSQTNDEDSLLVLAKQGVKVLYITPSLNSTFDSIQSPFYDYDNERRDTISYFFTNSKLTQSDTLRFVNRVNTDYYWSHKRINYLQYYFDAQDARSELIKIDSNKVIFGVLMDSTRNIYYHLNPTMFVNNYFTEDDAKEHMEGVLSYFEPKQVYYSNQIRVSSNKSKLENPLAFIFDHRSLKSAYLLALIVLAISAFFKSKRRVKVIPVLKKKENTSLEYIKMLSDLYLHNGQHHKVVRKLENIFYHEMQRLYYIPKNTIDYTEKLAKKSKINIDKLNFIERNFKEAEQKKDFSDAELMHLFREIFKLIKKTK